MINKVPNLNSNYMSAESRQKAVAILGSSASTESIEKYLKASSDITRHFVEEGFNIVHGCGSQGIMGEVYNAAKDVSIKDSTGKPLQNLAIIVQPLWGDENLQDCILIGKANSEAERIVKFTQVADNFVIFPGSTTTLQEASTLIQNNRYQKSNEVKKVILFGSDFWEGLISQYKKMFEMNLLKENPIGKLFQIANSKKEVFKLILRK
ncbi:MAG: LOG family protein [Candidatus Gastranaerophilaceae bacterium]